MWTIENHLPPGVAENLGHYVYLYIDPDSGEPFYVGKGVGERVLSHLADDQDSEKTRKIHALRESGRLPKLEILAHGLRDDETAFRVEAAVIDALGIGSLTNRVSGWKSLQVGRMSLDDLVGFYAAKPAKITYPVLLIRINKLFRKGMTERELYEATRGIWRVGPRRNHVQYSFAVFHGLVREVYAVNRWFPANTLKYKTRDLSSRDLTGRWEFEGNPAPPDIRLSYINRSVKEYFKPGNQSPVVYVKVPK